jgi:CubicO group peptidase (beta-lactamase class C family)
MRLRSRASWWLATGTLGLAAILPSRARAASLPDSSTESKVAAVFAAYDRTDSPGCAVGVFRDGRVALARGYGMANLELGVSLSPASVLDIGSTAKQFTAFSILLLERDGKLSLDDDIRRFVPEIPSYGPKIAIRNLLNHTSGLRDYLELMELAGVREEDLTTEQDALDVLTRQKATNFAPGTEHLYSNSGYFLLSVIVRRASGKSLRDFARERIFEPLGMGHTQFNDDHGRIVPNRATGYAPRKEGGFRIDMSDFEQTGDGGLQTTVEDLFRWNENFFHPAVGDAKLLEEMQTPGRLTDGKPLTYAFGLVVGKERGLKLVSHGGAWVGYRAQLLRYPDERVAVACLCNLSTANPSALARRVAEVYLGERMTAPEEPAKAAARPGSAPSSGPAPDRLAGAYRQTKSGDVWFFSTERGVLVAEVSGQKIAFDPVGADRFAARDGGGGPELRVLSAPGGRPRLETRWTGEETEVLEPISTWSPSPSELTRFAGSYASDEVGGVFRFEAVDGKLVLRHRTIKPDPWRPTQRDSFTASGIQVRFERDASGKVTGFRLDVGRVRGLVFRRAAA